MGKFEVRQDGFYYNGKQARILSGAVHYFRVVPEYWHDRLLKLKACGLNTVETYVAWNLHEPRKGEFCFEGIADIARFIKTAWQLGLHVIVRPGPYICAEWDFGGFPGWLLNEPGIRLRCFNKPYLERVDAFFDVLCRELKPFLCTNGGPIIAMQVENEYGSYGNDKKYLEYLKEGLKSRGIDVLLFTSDGPGDLMLQGGTLPDVLKTVNFGSKPDKAREKLREYQPDGPVMCMEFWNGWFDHWEEEHHTRPVGDAAETLDRMLQTGYSVNLYMFHGGTNFGFYNGANCGDKYQPTITSYDYDAAVSEDGELTPKFYAFKDIIAKYTGGAEVELPPPQRKAAYGKVVLDQKQGLFDSLGMLSQPVQSAYPVPMESLGQSFGYILYRTVVKGPRLNCTVEMKEVHDRACVYLNGRFVDVVYRGDGNNKLQMDFDREENILEILVENMGRTNYGQYLADAKGITENVRLDYQFQYGWEIFPLPLDNLEKLQFKNQCTVEGAAFYRGSFAADQPADTFIRMDNWHKGCVFINGFNLGRYWEKGPQKTLYLPAPLLKAGTNEITVFELHGVDKPEIELSDKADLG